MLKSTFILLGTLLFFGRHTFACYIDGYPGNIVTLPPQNETLLTDALLASFSLVNVNYTTTVPSPHNAYVLALRYPTGAYELVATASFQNFIVEERASQITRQANLYCMDGSTVQVTFVIPIVDFNNQPPTFDQVGYNATVEIPVHVEEGYVLIETRIVVSDSDYDPDNAQIEFTLDSSSFIRRARPLWNGSYPDSYEYEVSLLVINNLEAGVYKVNVSATDGVHESWATVEVTVEYEKPVEEPTEEPGIPIEEPTEGPEVPIEEPTDKPEIPVEEPTDEPDAPIEEPTEEPGIPIDEPTDKTDAPIVEPTDKPEEFI